MIAGLAIAAQMTIWNHSITGKWEENYITLFYTFTAVAIFIFVKKGISLLETRNKIRSKVTYFVQFVSSTIFGIYLFENILEKFTEPVFDMFNTFIPTIIACGMWLIVTMLFGSIVIGLLKKIPGIKNIL